MIVSLMVQERVCLQVYGAYDVKLFSYNVASGTSHFAAKKKKKKKKIVCVCVLIRPMVFRSRSRRTISSHSADTYCGDLSQAFTTKG